MSVMRSEDGKNLIVDCSCGCNDGFRIKIDEYDKDLFALVTYTNGNFYKEQNESFWRVFCKKIKKIWRIIRNKDYCYSEVCMSKEDFKEFQAYVSSIEVK